MSSPSKSSVLVREIAAEFERQWPEPCDIEVIDLAECGREFTGALSRDELSAEAEAKLAAIESADVLVVGSPVYRASFTGLFKHVFDFVGQYALVDKPVLLSASGGSDRHALILEHQFRPLFAFFQALTLPLGVYASDAEFTDDRITSDALTERFKRAVSRGIPVVRATRAE